MYGTLSYRSLLPLAFALLTVSCSTIRTHTDYDTGTDFTSYKSFTWIDEESLIRPTGDYYISPLDVQRIRVAIESRLIAAGYQRVGDSAAADFLVSFTVGTRDKIDVNTWPAAYSGRWVGHWPYYGEAVDVHTYTEGTLAIDIFDRATKRPVWHGSARKRIGGSNIDESGRLIQEAVEVIVSEFPPADDSGEASRQ